MEESTKNAILTNAAAAGVGATVGAITKHSFNPHLRQGQLAVQVGSAMGAAAVTGAGLSGTVSAGAAVVTAKVTVIAAASLAAAPVVLAVGAAGAIGYVLFKIFED